MPLSDGWSIPIIPIKLQIRHDNVKRTQAQEDRRQESVSREKLQKDVDTLRLAKSGLEDQLHVSTKATPNSLTRTGLGELYPCVCCRLAHVSQPGIWCSLWPCQLLAWKEWLGGLHWEPASKSSPRLIYRRQITRKVSLRLTTRIALKF